MNSKLPGSSRVIVFSIDVVSLPSFAWMCTSVAAILVVVVVSDSNDNVLVVVPNLNLHL